MHRSNTTNKKIKRKSLETAAVIKKVMIDAHLLVRGTHPTFLGALIMALSAWFVLRDKRYRIAKNG